MIRIEKGPAPAFLTDNKRKWVKETNKAILHYSEPDAEPFPFKVYNDKAVKEALSNVFAKCAYCDGDFKGYYDGDVEHFRPKLKVRGKDPETPGYYWLANDWDNLLLSCQHCNQARNQEIVVLGQPRTRQTLGKMEQFPLRPQGIWLTAPGPTDIENEFRLLLNPCIDYPEEHFDYEDTEAAMIPKTDQARTSIEVYALRRSELVKQRNKIKTLLALQIELLERAFTRYRADPSEDNTYGLRLQWEAVRHFTEDDAIFAGMARFFVKRCLVRNNILIPKV